MANGHLDAGAMPAFVEYAKLGAGYALLWEQTLRGRTVHAYLLAGPRGVGKATFVRLLAATYFCESHAKPCGRCPGCTRVLTGNEPDVIAIASQEDKAIPIDRVRAAIAQISQHSFGQGPRIVIVEPVEKMTPAAQNCLLKSLEEPQADVIFFLLTHEPSALLGTIASRCAMVKLPPWPDRELQTALLAMGFDASRVQNVLPRAAGIIGQALLMLSDEAGEGDMRALVAEALTVATDAQVVSLSTRLKEDQTGSERALTALEQALHTALLTRSGVLPAQGVGDAAVRAWAENATVDELAALLEASFHTRRMRQSQVNWQASIDRLLMKILEAKTKWQQS